VALALNVPASADNGNHFGNDNGNNGNHFGQVRGAPGPLAGAGLPVILVGAGIYWKKDAAIGDARISQEQAASPLLA
jgi:hypothetical protein